MKISEFQSVIRSILNIVSDKIRRLRVNINLTSARPLVGLARPLYIIKLYIKFHIMLFSECAESNGIGKLSPNGENLVLSKGLNVKLYELTERMRFLTKWSVLDEVTKFEWSPDGSLILCGQHKRGVVHIFNIHTFSWSAFLNNGICGISNSLFAPDSRQVLTYSILNTRITIWNLVDSKTSSLSFPKYLKKGLSFSKDGRTAAVLVRETNKDIIRIYNSIKWTVISDIDTDFSVKDILYLPDSSGIAAWSTEVEYIFVVFSLDGEELARYSPSAPAPMLSRVRFTPAGNYVALCGFNKTIQILHFISWVKYHDFNYSESLQSANNFMIRENDNFALISLEKSQLQKLQILIGKSKSTSHCLWSESQHHLLTVLESLPHMLWLWSLSKLQLEAVFVMQNSVKAVLWHGEHLVWTCGESLIYTWDQCEVQVLDQSLPSVCSLQCASKHLLLQTKSQAIYAKLTNC